MNTRTVRTLITIFFVFNLLTVLLMWFGHSGYLFIDGVPGGAWIALGRLAGLFAQIGIMIQIILIARFSFIEQHFGHDKMNAIHRTLGFWLLASFVLHPLLLVIGYAVRNEQSYGSQIASFLNDWPLVGYALLGVILMILVGISSLRVIRSRVRYETWYGVHLLTYGAILLTFLHQTQSGDVASELPYLYWISLNGAIGFLFILYRWIRPIYLSRKHRFTIEKLVPEAPGVTSVYISGRDLKTFTYEAGQYGHIRIHNAQPRTLSERYALLFPHPFSFSKAQDGESIRFSIKSLGDFTALIPTITPGTRVTIAGPLGRFTQKAARTEKFLLIAGGIGITPLRSLAQSLSSQGKDTVMLYSARTKADLALLQELRALPGIKLICLCSDATPEDAPHIIPGMLDAERIKALVPDVITRDAYVCGPPALMDSMIAALEGHGVPKNQIHFEKFSY